MKEGDNVRKSLILKSHTYFSDLSTFSKKGRHEELGDGFPSSDNLRPFVRLTYQGLDG